jgi:hypothetical protein
MAGERRRGRLRAHFRLLRMGVRLRFGQKGRASFASDDDGEALALFCTGKRRPLACRLSRPCRHSRRYKSRGPVSALVGFSVVVVMVFRLRLNCLLGLASVGDVASAQRQQENWGRPAGGTEASCLRGTRTRLKERG